MFYSITTTSTQINLSKCPSCRINLQYKLCRCLLAEQMIAELPYQCPSCYDVIPRRLIKLHEYKLCPNRYVLCRYNLVGCLWKGKYNDLNSHLLNCDYKQKTVEDIEKYLVKKLINYELYLMNEIQFSKSLLTKLNYNPIGLKINSKTNYLYIYIDDLLIVNHTNQFTFNLSNRNNCILLNFLLFIKCKNLLEFDLGGNQNLCLGEPINVQMRFEHGNEDGQSQLYQSLYSDNSIVNESGNSNVTTTTPQDQLRLGRLTRLWELPSSNLLHPILDSLLSNNISTTTTTTTSLSSATRCTDRTNRGIDYCINPLVVTITSLSSGDDEDSENNLRQNGIPASDFITRHLGLQQNNSDEDDESGEDEDNSSDSEHESNEEPEETTYSDNDDEVVNKTLEENNNALIEMDEEEESVI
ncbi:unnamed protein product [Heterobilharzia americana]|nr:unnamed protein product [Heterobilharzia americana]